MASGPGRRMVLQALAATLAAGRAGATPPAYRGAGELVAALAARSISSRELTDTAIARIEALDGRTNAVVVRDFDRARAAADAADAALARGERRPLLGLPMTVKEQFNVAGLPTTWGEPKFRDWRAPEDALAVARLKAAGAVILGKTNVPLQLTDWQSYNEVYGTTNNPWDPGRTPGGSSGGAAAALAAGFVALELGSDIGGSLRAPAHYCGVFAHKPSIDLIPLRGSGPPATPALPARFDLPVVGPMARGAADLALALDVLAGPDPLWDGIGYRPALPPPRRQALPGTRVLVLDRHPLFPTAAAVAGALDTLADRLAAAGCAVSRRSPLLPDPGFVTRLYVELLSAFFVADLPQAERQRLEAFVKPLTPDKDSLLAARIRGLLMTHPDWVRAMHVRDGLRARFQALFQDIDVLICPCMPTPAFPHDHSPQRTRRLDVDGSSQLYDDQLVWAGMATLLGLPATAVPVGRSEAGLPIGAQIIGGYLEDTTTIAFAGLIEREFGGFTAPPGY